jgi:hypothetical protein
MFIKTHISYPLLSLLLLFGACKPQQSPKRSKKEKAPPVVPPKPKEVPNVNFDLTGFLNAYNYKVQYESFGFLNGDNLKDKVLVLQEYNEGGIYNPRLTMVLLGNKNGFWLYSQSQTIFPAEYSTETNAKEFDTEEVKIVDGKLVFDLYATGPNGHIYFDYILKNDKLTLNELTGVFIGAGSHNAITYLAKSENNGTVKETEVVTMDEETLPETTTRQVKLTSPTDFEVFYYNRCLQEIMQ